MFDSPAKRDYISDLKKLRYASNVNRFETRVYERKNHGWKPLPLKSMIRAISLNFSESICGSGILPRYSSILDRVNTLRNFPKIGV